jgi:hypothetical protein
MARIRFLDRRQRHAMTAEYTHRAARDKVWNLLRTAKAHLPVRIVAKSRDGKTGRYLLACTCHEVRMSRKRALCS